MVRLLILVSGSFSRFTEALGESRSTSSLASRRERESLSWVPGNQKVRYQHTKLYIPSISIYETYLLRVEILFIYANLNVILKSAMLQSFKKLLSITKSSLGKCNFVSL